MLPYLLDLLSKPNQPRYESHKFTKSVPVVKTKPGIYYTIL